MPLAPRPCQPLGRHEDPIPWLAIPRLSSRHPCDVQLPRIHTLSMQVSLLCAIASTDLAGGTTEKKVAPTRKINSESLQLSPLFTLTQADAQTQNHSHLESDTGTSTNAEAEGEGKQVGNKESPRRSDWRAGRLSRTSQIWA
jgi:hypothetical protein